jgi:hypothetical protein
MALAPHAAPPPPKPYTLILFLRTSMTNSEQDVIIDPPSSHLEEDAGDEVNAAQLGESSKN